MTTDTWDHRPVVADPIMGLVLDKLLKNIVLLQTRQLNSEEYIAWLDNEIYNKLHPLLGTTVYLVSDEVACSLDLEGIDLLLASLVLCTGKKCHNKLKTAHYEFSPEVKWWLDRYHAFRQLIRLRMGSNISNIENVKSFARQCGINNPMQHSMRDLLVLHKECKERTK